MPFFSSKVIIIMLTNFLDKSVNSRMKASRTERESEIRRWLASRRGYFCIKQECRWAFQSQFSNFRGFKSIFLAEVSTLMDFSHESSYKNSALISYLWHSSYAFDQTHPLDFFCHFNLCDSDITQCSLLCIKIIA